MSALAPESAELAQPPNIRRWFEIRRRPTTLGTFGRAVTWATAPRRLGFVGYALLQLGIIAGLPTPRYPDSAYYLHFSLTGGSNETPTVPLVYAYLPNDPTRIAAQTLIAAIAWWLLASVVASLVEDRRVRYAAQGVVLALGVVGPVANWNSALLSESISISCTALLVAAWMRYAQSPDMRRAILVIVASVLWTNARQAHVYLSFLVLIVAFVAAIRHRRRVCGWVLAGALTLISVSGLSIANNGNNYVGGGVLADTIAGRILPNPAFTSWFVQHGMPYNSAIAAAANSPFGNALLVIPEFQAWNVSRGTRTYIDFMATHLRYTLWEPLASFSGEQPSLVTLPPATYAQTQPDPTPSLLSPNANYGRHRDVLPAPIADLLFDPGQFGDVVVLGALGAIAATLARRKYGRDRRLLVPLLIVASTIPHGYFVWLVGANGEQDRVAVVLAVALRVALWSILACSIDRLVRGSTRISDSTSIGEASFVSATSPLR